MSEIATAERLLRLRREAINDVARYNSQLIEMSREYGLDIDLCDDKVRYHRR